MFLIVPYLFLTLTLFACASSPESTDPGTSKEAAPAESVASDSAADGNAAADSSQPETEAAPATDTTAEAKPDTEPAKAEPPRVVDSCKDEAYIKYDKQARESMEKGLAATKADKFGVGFRSVEEHNQWTKIHGALFKKVNASCEVLAECGKKHKKDKDTECVAEAKAFSQWQAIAKDFANKAKMAETTQPPKICSISPNLNDAARCFHGLAENIKAACDSDECTELAQCWDSVGYLDKAIIQAEQACGFVHQKLSTCRGYTEATGRREAKFKKCQDLHGRTKIEIYPTL